MDKYIMMMQIVGVIERHFCRIPDQIPCPARKLCRYQFVTVILHACTSHRYGVPLPLHRFFRFRHQSRLLHFGGVAALRIVMVI